MLVILLLLYQTLYLLFKTDKKDRKKVTTIVLVALFLNIVCAVVLYLELLSKNTFTYGSDEADYFGTMLNGYYMENGWFNYLKNDFNFIYVLYGTIILKTSFGPYLLLIRISNALMGVNTLLLIYIFIKRNLKYNTEDLYTVLWFISLNGIVIWTNIRNLKDTFFLYVLLIFLIAFFDMFNKKGILKNSVILAVSVYVLSDIRQWFPYFFVTLILSKVVMYLLKKRRYFQLAVTGLVCFVLISPFVAKGFEILRLYVTTRFLGQAQIFKLPMYMANFIVGPGPIRSLFPTEAYLFSSNIGNVLIFLGSLIWWLCLPLFILSICSLKNIKNNFILFYLIMFYWIMYSYANLGTGDTRMRAIIYALSGIYALPYLQDVNKKNFTMKYFILLILVFLFGSVFSYLSLKS